MDSVGTSPDDAAVECSCVSYLQNVVPQEVLQRILVLLQPLDKFRLRLTCRRMYLAVNDPAAWRSLLFDYYHTASRKALDTILSLCSYGTKELEINCRHLVSRFPWARFTKHVSKCSSSLHRLRLLGILPSPQQLSVSLDACAALAHLTLDIKWEKGIYFPRVPSLKSFEVQVEFVYDLISPLQAWSQSNFFPRRFIITSRNHKSLTKSIDEITFFAQSPFTLPLNSQCTFLAMRSDGPLKIFCRYPFLEVILENSECYVPVTTCSSIASSPLLLVLSNPQCATRITTSGQLPRICRNIQFSAVPPTLAHLVLKDRDEVDSESLHEISRHLPGLKSLSLNACVNTLDNLSGLASISQRCLQLEGLNISNIHAIADKTALWHVLSAFTKLRYLAVDFCSLPLDSPQQKIRMLLFLQIGYAVPSPVINCITCRTVSNASLTILGHLLPVSLKVLWMSEQPGARFSIDGCGLRDLLCSLPNLECLNLDTASVFSLPTDPLCYERIEKLSLACPGCYITSEFVLALIKNRHLTHCYLTARSIELEAVSRLVRAPRLICLHLGIYEKPLGAWKSKACQAAKAQSIAEFSAHVLPSVSRRTHSDLMSLQYLEL